MPRWDKHSTGGYSQQPLQRAGERSHGASSCHECKATVANLKRDRTDGRLYCTACWDAWHQEHQAPSVRTTAEASKSNIAAQQSAAKFSVGMEEHTAIAVSEGDTDCETTAVASNASTLPLPLGHQSFPAAVANEGFPEASESASPPAMGSAFSRQVSELRGRYSADTNTDAQEQQLEEIEMLQAIYGETLQQLATGHGEPYVLRLELPTELGSEGCVDIVICTPDGEIGAGSVKTLPPLILLCALPAKYPESEMPVFSLEAEHLNALELHELREELHRLAVESAGQPLLFMWASALQERPPPPQRLLLGNSDGEGGLAENMEQALELLAHDQKMRDERRQREMQRCPICFDDVLGSRGLFLPCGHFGCKECLGQMAQIYTGEADLSSLRCPCQGCSEPFGIEAVTELLGADSPVLARWEELSLQRCLDRMDDVAFCPRCDADGSHVPCIQDGDNMAKCEVCGFVFCGKCKSVFHPDTPCADRDDQMWALEQRARGQGKEAEVAQGELLTLRLLERTTRNCPKCTTAIQKSEGCNKMHCKNCGDYFCWKCGKEITGYDHFASSECRLFDDDEIRRWNQQMNPTNRAQARAHEAQFLAQFVDHASIGDQGRQCPRCKNVVTREGRNNHLRCFACQTPFCAKCGVVLPNKNAGQHFNLKGTCPQHSD